MSIYEDLNNKLLEYTEEPDAFETQTEREMEQAYLDELDKQSIETDKRAEQNYYKNRYIAMKKVYAYMSKVPFIRDLSLVKGNTDKRYNYIQFWMPNSKLSWLGKWKEKFADVIREGRLNIESRNASVGNTVTIQ